MAALRIGGWGYQPEGTRRPAHETAGGARPEIMPQEQGAALGKGLANVGRMLLGSGEEMRAEEDRNFVLSAKAEAARAIDEELHSWRQDVNGEDSDRDMARLQTHLHDVRRAAMRGAAGSRRRESLELELEPMILAATQRGRKHAEDAVRARGNETRASQLDMSIRAAQAAGNLDGAALDEWANMVMASPLLSDAEKEEEIRAGRGMYWEASLISYAQSDPRGFARRWDAGEFDGRVDASARVRLEGMAERARTDAAYDRALHEDHGGDREAAVKALDDPGYREELGLSNREAHSLQGILSAEQSRLEREERERAAARMAVLENTLEDSMASGLDTGVFAEGTGAMIEEMAGLGERGAALAEKFRGVHERGVRAFAVLEACRMSPPGEQVAALESLRPVPGAENYASDAEIYRRAARTVSARLQALSDDPAGYVAEEARRAAVRAGVDPDEDVAGAVGVSLGMQRDLGVIQPRAATETQAAQLAERWEACAPGQRMALLQDVRGVFGEHAGQVLGEAEIGPEAEWALALYESGHPMGRVWAEILAAPAAAGDLGLAPTKKSELEQKVWERIAGSDFFEVLTWRSNMQPMNREAQEHLGRMSDMVVNAGLRMRDPAAAVGMFEKTHAVLADDDLAMVVCPAWMGSILEDRLYHARAALSDDVLSWEARQAGMDEFSVWERVEDLRGGGVWINSPDGKGFNLFNPVTGGVVRGPDGLPVFLSYEEVK